MLPKKSYYKHSLYDQEHRKTRRMHKTSSVEKGMRGDDVSLPVKGVKIVDIGLGGLGINAWLYIHTHIDIVLKTQ